MTRNHIFTLFRRLLLSITFNIYVLFLFQSNVIYTANETFSSGSFNKFYAQKAFNLTKDFKNHIRSQLSPIFDQTKAYFQDGDFNQSCFKQLEMAFKSKSNDPSFEWLVEMFIASGGISSGIFSGTTTSLGDFDHCLEMSERMHFPSTQYCLLTLHAYRQKKYVPIFGDNKDLILSSWERSKLEQWLISDNKVPIAIGLCLPATCSDQEKQIISNTSFNLARHFDANVEYCQAATSIVDILLNIWPLILVLSFLTMLIILGSFLDYLATTRYGIDYAKPLEHIIIKLIRCFSLISNCNLVFNVQNHNDSKSKKNELFSSSTANETKKEKSIQLDILVGIRILAIGCIITSHSITFSHVPRLMKVSPLAHFPFDLFNMEKENWLISVFLLSGYFSVSTFFLMSGILAMYNKKCNKKCEVKWHFCLHFVKRFLRLNPTFLAVIGITYYLQYLGTGPLFHPNLIKPYVEPCRTYFWHHFFMLHNMLPFDQRCGSHTWYIAADFQLYLLAFVVIHLIRCRSKCFTGLIIIVVLIAASSVIPVVLSILGFGGLPNPSSYNDLRIELSHENWFLFYYATYNHAHSYFIGVLLGYLLSSERKFYFLKKNKLFLPILFYGSLALLAIIPFTIKLVVYPKNLTDSDWSQSPIFITIVFQFFSYLFNFVLSGFILASTLKPSFYLCKAMSAKILHPISRFVFCAYLSHQMFIWFSLNQLREPFSINIFSMASFTLKIFCMTCIFSVILNLMIECPFGRMSYVMLGAFEKPKISTLKSDIQNALEPLPNNNKQKNES